MTSLEKISTVSARLLQEKSTAHLEKWARMRKWSRTDTARWLTDHTEPVIAQLRRLGSECPQRPRSVGFWLKDMPTADHALFGRAHDRLAALTSDEQRDRALVTEILR